MEFEPQGRGEQTNGLLHPFQAINVGGLSALWHGTGGFAQDALDEAHSRYGGSTHNDAGDAFRHVYWSALITFWQGAESAKQWTDAHERSHPNDAGEQVMDLYNNHIGRQIGLDALASSHSLPGFPSLSGWAAFATLADRVQEAVDNGRTVNAPINVQNPSSTIIPY